MNDWKVKIYYVSGFFFVIVDNIHSSQFRQRVIFLFFKKGTGSLAKSFGKLENQIWRIYSCDQQSQPYRAVLLQLPATCYTGPQKLGARIFAELSLQTESSQPPSPPEDLISVCIANTLHWLVLPPSLLMQKPGHMWIPCGKKPEKCTF